MRVSRASGVGNNCAVEPTQGRNDLDCHSTGIRPDVEAAATPEALQKEDKLGGGHVGEVSIRGILCGGQLQTADARLSDLCVDIYNGEGGNMIDIHATFDENWLGRRPARLLDHGGAGQGYHSRRRGSVPQRVRGNGITESGVSLMADPSRAVDSYRFVEE